MSQAPILVTGAGGFVCSEIALALQQSGRRVVATDQEFDAQTAARLKDIEQIEGPLGTVLEAMSERRFSAVVHGAATTAGSEQLGISRADHLRRNLDPLLSALSFARAAEAGRFVFLSSTGVFKPTDGPLTAARVTEKATPTADYPYAAAKRAGEMVTATAAESGFETLSVRLGNICGPTEMPRPTRPGVSVFQRMIDAANRGATIHLTSPSAVREWAWLPDLARGIAALLQAPFGPRPVLHTGNPPTISDSDLAHEIARRRPGKPVAVAHARDEAIRPPMGSDADTGPFAALSWTPVNQILDRLMPMQAPA